MAQIILKDLRPALYPFREDHYTAALINYNTASVQMLTKEHAMKVWDPTGRMLKAYSVRSTLDEAAVAYESPAHQRELDVPLIGIPVEVNNASSNCSSSLV